MPDIYFDPNAPSGGNGTQAAPFNTMSQLAGQFVGGNRILFRAGTRTPVTGVSNRMIINKTGDGTLSIGAYGSGEAPKLFAANPATAFHLLDLRSVAGSAGPDGNHVVIEDFGATGSNFQGGIISAQPGQVVENVVLRRVDFSRNGLSTAAKGADGLTVTTAPYASGQTAPITRNILIEDSTFDDNGCHGTKARNAASNVRWVRCKARRNGFASPSHAFGGVGMTVRPLGPGITGYANQYSFVTVQWNSLSGNVFFCEWGGVDNSGVAWLAPNIMDFQLCNILYLSRNRAAHNVFVGRMVKREPGSQASLAAYEWCTDGVNANRVYCNFGTPNVGTGANPTAGLFVPAIELSYGYATDLYWEDCEAEDQFDYDGFEGTAIHLDDCCGFGTVVRLKSRRCHFGLVVNGGQAMRAFNCTLDECLKSPFWIWGGPRSVFHGITAEGGVFAETALVQGNGPLASDAVSFVNLIAKVGTAHGLREIGSANMVRSFVAERGTALIGSTPPSGSYYQISQTESPARLYRIAHTGSGRRIVRAI